MYAGAASITTAADRTHAIMANGMAPSHTLAHQSDFHALAFAWQAHFTAGATIYTVALVMAPEHLAVPLYLCGCLSALCASQRPR